MVTIFVLLSINMIMCYFNPDIYRFNNLFIIMYTLYIVNHPTISEPNTHAHPTGVLQLFRTCNSGRGIASVRP